MSEVVYLYLEFLDSDNNVRSVVVKNPKEEITLEEAHAAMQVLIDNDVIRTVTGASFASISNCYYRTVTKTPLVSEEAE